MTAEKYYYSIKNANIKQTEDFPCGAVCSFLLLHLHHVKVSKDALMERFLKIRMKFKNYKKSLKLLMTIWACVISSYARTVLHMRIPQNYYDIIKNFGSSNLRVVNKPLLAEDIIDYLESGISSIMTGADLHALKEEIPFNHIVLVLDKKCDKFIVYDPRGLFLKFLFLKLNINDFNYYLAGGACGGIFLED